MAWIEKVDVIIPTYQPGHSIIGLIEALRKQSLPVDNIIIINTDEAKWSPLPDMEGIILRHIPKDEFDHALSRNLGVGFSDARVFVLMTQDASPKDEYFLEKLIEPLQDEKIAASYARQIADEDADVLEKIGREFNYPEASYIKSGKDIDRLGIKTYFCSNVSCAYRKEIFDALGGFEGPAIFNEDMVYAAKAIKAGFSIAYSANAEVIHSHNYSGAAQFRRNIDIGISQAMHPEVFGNISSEGEGKRLVGYTLGILTKKGKIISITKFVYMCIMKYAGFQIGKHYQALPESIIRALSMNPTFFKMKQR